MPEQEMIPVEHQTMETEDSSDTTRQELEQHPLDKAMSAFRSPLELVKEEQKRTKEEGFAADWSHPSIADLWTTLSEARKTIADTYKELAIPEKEIIIKYIATRLEFIDILGSSKESATHSASRHIPTLSVWRREVGNLIADIAPTLGDDLDNEKFYQEVSKAMIIMAKGSQYVSGTEKTTILTELQRHWPILKDSIAYDLSAEKKEFSGLDYETILRPLLEYGDEALTRDITETIVQLLKTKGDHEIKMALGTVALQAEMNGALKEHAPVKQQVLEIANQYGLNGEKMFSHWQEGRHKEFNNGELEDAASRAVIENILELQWLEEKHPGIGKKLYDEFGLACYSRYDREVLIDQIENMDDITLPYGIVIYPRADYNGAFNRPPLLTSVANKLANKAHLRIAEVGNKYELMRTLLRFGKKYNPNGSGHKISFAILGGHGSINSIQFGEGGNFFELFSDDLYGESANRAADIFEPNPTIVLQSCSTGQDRGIGMTLSYILQARVVAPDVPTNIATIDASIHDGKIDLDITYNDEDSKKVYVPKTISRKKTE